MYGYIYITTNLINGKQYIGQKKSDVFLEDYKGSGRDISRAFNKYGFNNFKSVLIEECDSQEELDKQENMSRSNGDHTYKRSFVGYSHGA